MDTLAAGILSFIDYPYFEVDLQATPFNPKVESIEGCGLQEVESVILCRHVQNQPEMEQNRLNN